MIVHMMPKDPMGLYGLVTQLMMNLTGHYLVFVWKVLLYSFKKFSDLFLSGFQVISILE